MYVKQDGKFYIQDGDILVGVEIYPDKVLKVDGTETTLGESYQLLTPFEIRCKLNLDSGGSYIFPMPEKEVMEVDVNVTVDKTKSTSGKSKRK